jgi:hypothetical protein
MAKIYDAEMQYLHVAIAKEIGINSHGGVESYDSDTISRETAGLKPLLIYSMTAPCYGVKARTTENRDGIRPTQERPGVQGVGASTGGRL